MTITMVTIVSELNDAKLPKTTPPDDRGNTAPQVMLAMDYAKANIEVISIFTALTCGALARIVSIGYIPEDWLSPVLQLLTNVLRPSQPAYE